MHDITDLKASERTSSFLSAIVQSADDAIVSKTLTGIVTSWNPGAERLFGYSAEEMIGQPISLLIPPDRPNEEDSILARLCRGERIEHYETKRGRKNGEIIDISLTVSPVKDRQGHIIGASKIARDITYQKTIEAERNLLLEREQAARTEAQAANRLKDEFLALLSHESRTPLNAILGWVSILGKRQDDEELMPRALEVIQRNACVQKRLIEDLLDMSRILSGKLVIRSQKVDLNAVIQSALDSIRPSATVKSIRLEVQIEPSARFVTGDADRLQQVVWNLLSNSTKFTPEGGRIDIRLQRTNADIELVIRDTGQGIASDFLPFVFEQFRQAEEPTSRHHGRWTRAGSGAGAAYR
jgi:PAS domain S-box-containing protein